MSDFLTQTLFPHLRLAILRHAASTPGYEANESLLTDVVNDFGLVVSRDQVRTAIDWLVEQGLMTRREVAGLVVARVTTAGAEVAAGRKFVSGVKRPSAGD